MKQTGIIMSGNHPRLIQDGLKTMTRRVIIPQPIKKGNIWEWGITRSKGISIPLCLGVDEKQLTECMLRLCPYGQVGDLLWVRETWAVCSFSARFAETSQLQIAYRAGRTIENPHPDAMTHSLEWRTVDYETWKKYAGQKYYSWRPSLFMPKKFARIWCEITGLRAERLQEITEADAIAEGITTGYPLINPNRRVDLRNAYQYLWDSLNAKRGYPWAGNWWVWPIELKLGGRKK